MEEDSNGKPTDADKESGKEREEMLKHGFAKTRKSLIARLDNWEDQRTWDDFYQTYWRLIYSVGLKSGLRSEEAFDCVQETIIDRVEDPKGEMLDRIWDTEWKQNLAEAALEKVKAQVSPKQYQIFDSYVIKQWDAKRVQDVLGVSMAQVYLAKHRVGSVLKKEIAKLDKI